MDRYDELAKKHGGRIYDPTREEEQESKSIWESGIDAFAAIGSGFGSAGKVLASPFTRTAATAIRAGRGATALAGAGGRYLAGDTEGAKEIIGREQQIQERENANDRTIAPVETMREAVGVGAQLGTTLFAPGSVTVKGLGGIARGALAGGISGLFYGAGTGLEQAGDEEMDFGETVSQTAIEAAVGGATGVVAGAIIGKFMSRAGQLKKAEKAAAQKAAGRLKASVGKRFGPGAARKQQFEVMADIDEMVKQGFSIKDVDLMANADDQTKAVYRKIVEAANKEAAGRVEFDERAIAQLGDDVTVKLKHILNNKQRIGAQLGAAIDDKADEAIELSPAVDALRKELEAAKVRFTDEGLDFSKSVWKNESTAQGVINKVWDDLTDFGGTVMDAHIVTRRFDKVLPSEATINRNLLGDLKRLVGIADEQVTGILDAAVPGYAKTRVPYAKHAQFVHQFNKYMGTAFQNADEVSRSVRAGELANRLLSNASARPHTLFAAMDELAPGVGGSVFDEATFLSLVEDLWQITPERSLRGQTQKAGAAVMEGVRAAKGDVGAGFGLLRKLVGSSTNDRSLQKALVESLIMSLTR